MMDSTGPDLRYQGETSLAGCAGFNVTGNAQTAEVPGGGWTCSSCHAGFSFLIPQSSVNCPSFRLADE